MSSTNSTDDNKAGSGGAAALVALAVLVAALPYLPIVCFGVCYGLILVGGASEGLFWQRTLRVSSNLLFLVLVLTVLLGPPIHGSGYHGILDLKFSHGVTWYVVDTWNGWIQSIAVIFRGIRKTHLIVIGNLSYFEIQSYFFKLIPVSAIGAAVFGGLYAFKKSKPSRVFLLLSEGIRRTVWFYLNGVIIWPFRRAYEFSRPFLFLIILVGVAFLFSEKTKNISPKGPWLLLYVHFGAVMWSASIGNLLSIAVAILGRFGPTAWIVRLINNGSISAWNATVNRLNRKNPEVIVLGRQIENGLVTPEVFFTEHNLNYNVQVIGGSGTGKSNLIQLLLENRIARGSGVIFVDLKADFETVDWLTSVAAFYNCAVDLQVFSLTDRDISIPYNPLESGTLNEIHSRIMNALKWSEEYYRKTASAALSDVLMGLYELREKAQEYFTLEHLHAALSRPEILEAWAIRPELNQGTKNVLFERARRLKTREGVQEVAGLVTDLQLLIRSSAGGLLTEDASSKFGINLENAINERKIVYFLMNSMQDKESSVAIGKLLLQDLISTVGRIYKTVPEEDRQPVTLIVDEFASFATENFIDLLNRSRGAKMGIVVAHQSRGDLEAISPTFSDQVERNCNNKIIYGTDNPEDAECYAGMIGTYRTEKVTHQVQTGILWDNKTGMKSVREVDEFIIHPNQIKALGQGQALVIKRVVDPGYALVNLYRAEAAPKIADGLTAKNILTRARDVALSRPHHKMIELEVTPQKNSPRLAPGRAYEEESFL